MKYVGSALAVLVLLLASNANAAITASVNRTAITLADSLILTLRANAGEDLSVIDLSELRVDFDVANTSTSSRLSIVNGKSERSTELKIVLLPTRDGSLRIPSLAVQGQRTQAIDITVSKAPSGIDSSQDVFVEAEIDQNSVYVQSQLIHTFRIYQAIELTDRGRSQLEIPDAIVEELESNVFQRTVDGRPYRVIEVKHAIFPQKSGELTIPSISFTGRRELSRRSVFSFGSGEMVRRRSTPITINVKPIPASYPDATWVPASALRLQENWSSSPDTLEVGDSITRSITMTAEGIDASLLPQIEQTAIDGIRVYPDQAQTENKPTRRGITGTVVSSAALLITEAGQFSLPAIRVSWWDTGSNTLRYAELPARTLSVTGAQPSTDSSEPAAIELAQTQPASITDNAESNAPWRNPWMWATCAACLGWLLSVLWLRRSGPVQSTAVQTSKDEPNESQLYRRLTQCCAQNQAAEARTALQQWAQCRMQLPYMPTLAEIRAAYQSDTLDSAVAALEKSLFSPDAGSAWQGQELLKAVKALRKVSPQRTKTASALPPLYAAGS